MIKSILLYTKERFPLFPAIIFSILFGSVGITYANNAEINLLKIGIASGMVFLFLLRIRLWDEIKDYHYDSTHHCSRPVQKGVLSLEKIQSVSLGVLCIELSLQFFLPSQVALLFLVALTYSFFMYNNFFIKNFEDKSFSLCLLSHQLIFFIYIYYIFSIGSSHLYVFDSMEDLWMLLALFLPPLIYEIGRKVKHRISHSGYTTNDTYIYRWGETRSYLFLFFIMLLQSLSNFMIFRQLDLLFLSQFLSVIIVIFLYMINSPFIIATSKRWSIAIGMYGLIVLSIYIL